MIGPKTGRYLNDHEAFCRRWRAIDGESGQIPAAHCSTSRNWFWRRDRDPSGAVRTDVDRTPELLDRPQRGRHRELRCH